MEKNGWGFSGSGLGLGPGVVACVVFLFSVTACAGESAPVAPGRSGCRSDAECPVGTACGTDGLCRQSGGGGASGLGACEASDDCWADEPGVVPDVYWDGGEAGNPVCTVPQRTCPGADACEVPTACQQPPDGADRPGAFACERDEQCLSGRCLSLGESGICARSCSEQGDCPFFVTEDGVSSGFTCKQVNDRGILVNACLPIDDALPEATLCRTDCHCVAGDGCDPAAPPGGLACRFAGQERPVRGVPLCQPPPAGGGVPTLAACPEDPASCSGGACFTQCDAKSGGESHFCGDVWRCVEPCGSDADCPARTVCITAQDYLRIGTWLLSYQRPTRLGRELRFCLPPALTCFDELDCCPEPDGAGGCLRGWTADRGRCRVELAPPLSAPRLLTVCAAPDGRTEPGGCCESHQDCDSELCVPARPGSPCAGGGVCSVPCEPYPDPDGVPGSGDEGERCALGGFSSDYHLGSRCLPFEYVLTASDGSTRVEPLSACQ